jgi:hypothetical protein
LCSPALDRTNLSPVGLGREKLVQRADCMFRPHNDVHLYIEAGCDASSVQGAGRCFIVRSANF